MRVWSGGETYQLRVVIAGISPLIWRRLLAAADTTIAELHTILQTVFGWSGEHLHRFVIHGTDYGISYAGSEGFRDDARTVRLDGREIKGMRNLQEGRHSVARHLFHGRNGELYQAYREGMEDQLGALIIWSCCCLGRRALGRADS